jgi:hypothetical protein
MNRKALLALAGAVASLLSTAAVAAAGNGGLSDARAGTAQFHRIDAANGAGYTVEVIDLNNLACIDDIEHHTGGMGIHFLNPGLLDGQVDAATPELVIYEPTKNGGMRLVAVEYLTLKAAWDAAHGGPNAAPPSLFGTPFELVPAGNRYGLPDFYELHAWIWKENPLGMHNDWNPTVTCAAA